MQIMKKIKLLFATFLLFCGNFSDGFAADTYLEKKCRKIMAENPVDFNIYYDYGNLIYDRSKSAEEIKKLYIENKKQEPQSDKILGLTIFNSFYQIMLYTNAQKLRGRTYCYYPAKIDIKIGYKDTTMYLAKELKENTCTYKRTLRHEQTHLKFGEMNLALHVMTTKDSMKNIVNEIGPLVSTKSENEIRDELLNKYENKLGYTYSAVESINKRQNAKIDTLENYRKETAMCKD